jgi:hypothetical protein
MVEMENMKNIIARSFQSFYGVIQEEEEKKSCKTLLFYYEPVKGY